MAAERRYLQRLQLVVAGMVVVIIIGMRCWDKEWRVVGELLRWAGDDDIGVGEEKADDGSVGVRESDAECAVVAGGRLDGRVVEEEGDASVLAGVDSGVEGRRARYNGGVGEEEGKRAGMAGSGGSQHRRIVAGGRIDSLVGEKEGEGVDSIRGGSGDNRSVVGVARVNSPVGKEQGE